LEPWQTESRRALRQRADQALSEDLPPSPGEDPSPPQPLGKTRSRPAGASSLESPLEAKNNNILLLYYIITSHHRSLPGGVWGLSPSEREGLQGELCSPACLESGGGGCGIAPLARGLPAIFRTLTPWPALRYRSPTVMEGGAGCCCGCCAAALPGCCFTLNARTERGPSAEGILSEVHLT